MSLPPASKYRLAVLCGALVAIVAGWELGQGSYVVPVLVFAAGASFAVSRITRVTLDVAVTGLLLFGYLVGNRGFAQQLLTPGFPLLPAEAGLGLALLWLVVRSGWERRLPWNGDALNAALLAFFAVTGARLYFDVRAYGLLALRDFATVYYAAFFFVVQRQAETPANRRFLTGCLVAGVVVLLPGSVVNRVWPDFFESHFAPRGIPLIFYKNDLVQTMLAMGSIVLFHAGGTGRLRLPARLLALALAASVLVDNSRASLVGLGVACALLVASRNFGYARALGLACAVGALGSVAVTWVGGLPWNRNPLLVTAERVETIFDPSAAGRTLAPELADKADTNRFREVWWRVVAEETWNESPVLGLGFGYDLARTFRHTFENDLGDEFTARSPHNVMLTFFGRTGLVGLAAWLAVCALWLRRTWRILRDSDAGDVRRGIAAGSWVILASACFGVVLEGPMAALPFWIMLGLCSQNLDTDPAAAALDEPEDAADATSGEAASDGHRRPSPRL